MTTHCDKCSYKDKEGNLCITGCAYCGCHATQNNNVEGKNKGLANWQKKCPKCRRTLPDSFVKKLLASHTADIVGRVEKLPVYQEKFSDGSKGSPKLDKFDVLTAINIIKRDNK